MTEKAIPIDRAMQCVLKRDHRDIGERSDAVLRTAMPGEELNLSRKLKCLFLWKRLKTGDQPSGGPCVNFVSRTQRFSSRSFPRKRESRGHAFGVCCSGSPPSRGRAEKFTCAAARDTRTPTPITTLLPPPHHRGGRRIYRPSPS